MQISARCGQKQVYELKKGQLKAVQQFVDHRILGWADTLMPGIKRCGAIIQNGAIPIRACHKSFGSIRTENRQIAL